MVVKYKGDPVVSLAHLNEKTNERFFQFGWALYGDHSRIKTLCVVLDQLHLNYVDKYFLGRV